MTVVRDVTTSFAITYFLFLFLEAPIPAAKPKVILALLGWGEIFNNFSWLHRGDSLKRTQNTVRRGVVLFLA